MIGRAVLPAMAVAMLAMQGCGPTLQTWTNAAGSSAGADEALAECQFEAQAATASLSRPADGSTGVDAAVATGVERGMEQSDLIASCMRARGFRS